jgi:branched-chain amino acid transport system ATP-binding protein
MLEVVNLVAGYGKLKVLENVSLRVGDREIVSVVGPNGAGKTTLLNSIMGLAEVYSGRVYFNGTDITGLKTEKRVALGLSYSPQTNNVFPNLSVLENLLLGAYTRRHDRLRDDIEDVFRLFPELADRAKSKAKNLSGGERQMLAIARALMSKPKLLLLDEPTTGLSPKASKSLLNKLLEIKSMGVSILLVEQNVDYAMSVADRVYHLVEGRIAGEYLPGSHEARTLIETFLTGRKTS